MKKLFTTAIVRLSRASGLYPSCLIVRGVRKIGDSAVTAGSFGDVWKGEMQGHIVAIKELKVYEQSDIEKILKVCLVFKDGILAADSEDQIGVFA